MSSRIETIGRDHFRSGSPKGLLKRPRTGKKKKTNFLPGPIVLTNTAVVNVVNPLTKGRIFDKGPMGWNPLNGGAFLK